MLSMTKKKWYNSVAEKEVAQSQLRVVAEACPEAVKSVLPNMPVKRGKHAITKKCVECAVLSSCAASSASSKTRTRRVTRGEAAIAEVSHTSMVDGTRVLLDETEQLSVPFAAVTQTSGQSFVFRLGTLAELKANLIPLHKR